MSIVIENSIYRFSCPGEDVIISPQSSQRTQSEAILALWYAKVLPQRLRTRMTRIGRIFTDPCASVSTVTPVDCVHTYALAYVDVYSARSVFYRNPSGAARASAFIRVNLYERFIKRGVCAAYPNTAQAEVSAYLRLINRVAREALAG